MVEKFCFFISKTLVSLSPEKLLLISLFAIAFAFVFSIVLCLCLTRYTLIKRLWFVGFCFAFVLFQTGHCLIVGNSLAYAMFTASVSTFFSLPIFCVFPRKKTLKKEQKELADFLDRTVENAKKQKPQFIKDEEIFNQPTFIEQTLPAKTNLPIEKLSVSAPLEKKEDLPDFSHVKNVMERLSNFSLTPFDKRQVKDLEIAIKRIENGENSSEAKNKINDGLSSLLKIMSKYGV